jgi:polyisoprenoid-binding protein YceI
VVLLAGVGTSDCKDDAAQARVAPPAASAALATPGAASFHVEESGNASFLIDAPLEKIKGHSGRLRGSLTLDPKDLGKTSGEVDVDLADLTTETFEDRGKNSAQTEHAHNWLEIGNDVDPKAREENRFARFTFHSVDTSTTLDITSAAEQNGERKVGVTVNGNLWLHGATAPKTVKLMASIQGPPASPTRIRLQTAEPLTISLKEHDIKPRDVAGKFLAGALEKIGNKITDSVQVSLDVTAVPMQR